MLKWIYVTKKQNYGDVIMKKITVSTILSMSLLLNVAGPQFASAQQNQSFIQEINLDELGITAQIQQDDENVRIVKVVSGDGTSIVQYDKKNDLVSIDENGATYEINLAEERPKLAKKMAFASLDDIGDYDVVDDYEDYWWDLYVTSYDYYEVGEYFWSLSDGDSSKTTWESSANSSELGDFKDRMLDLRSKQRETAAASTVSTASLIAGVASAPATAGVGTVVGLVLAIGAGALAASLAGDAQDIRRDMRSILRKIEIVAYDEL